jgi:pSer/pThr/pTyr-binding forkhead associated (FHA) protein
MESFGRLILNVPDHPEQIFDLAGDRITLGRAPTNEIILQDAKVSRSHARIEFEGSQCSLRDLNSSNGTRVNGSLVESADLSPGDVITIGDCTLRYEIDFSLAPTQIEQIHSDSELDTTLETTSLEATINDTNRSRLVIITADKTWETPLELESITIGRHPESDIILDSPRVSRHHARIERRNDSFIIRDLDSMNGIWLGRKRIQEKTLHNGDTLQIGEARLVFKEGFIPEELTVVETPLDGGKKKRRRPLVFVPGLMGSELWMGNEMIWPRVRYLFTRPEILSLPDFRPFRVGEIVHEVVIVPNLIKQDQYNLLGDYLEEGLGYQRGHDFLEFAYDWRKDVRDSARQLAERIDSWDVAQPITLIGHSLGTLVTRYYIEKLGGKHRVARVILLGGPHSGVPFAITSLFAKAELLPFGILGERLREVLSTFPSAYQILPTFNCVYDQNGQPINILEDESWLPEEQRPFLRMAREFRRELGTTSSVPAVSIFGYGIDTVTRIQVQRDSLGNWEKMDIETSPNGDDRIPEGSAVMQDTEIHPVQQHHGKLFVDNDVKMRLKMELTR